MHVYCVLKEQIKNKCECVVSTMAESQEYCLQRKNHSSDMIEIFDRMYKDESLTDVTLMCDDGTIKAHRIVLSACSSYFKSIFDKITNTYQYPVVIMRDLSIDDLRAIIEFIYRGEVTVPQEQLESVLKSAEWLKIKGLTEEGINTKEKHSNDESVDSNHRTRKRRKRRRKRTHDEHPHRCNDHASDENGEKHDEEQSDDISDEYSDGDGDVCHSLSVTPTDGSAGRNFTEGTNANDGDIEPSRLLEQSMITGDTHESSNGVPRYASSNTHHIATVDDDDVKPIMYEETSGLIPQGSSLPTQPLHDGHSSSGAHNHTLTLSSGACNIPNYHSGIQSIPGPSNASHSLPRAQSSHGKGSGEYQCLWCFKRYDLRYSLLRHIRVLHEQKTVYMCNYCGRRFAWKSAYLRHVKISCQYKPKKSK